MLGGAFKATLLDPTTYAAPALYYDATMRDWNTSQPFFRAGYLEVNPRFTISGRSNDTPVSYTVGRNQILSDTLALLAISAAHNFTSQLLQRSAATVHPDHRKAVAVIGTIERIAVSSFISYHVAAPHYRQWRANQELMNQLGIR
jgi:hypothetical protein